MSKQCIPRAPQEGVSFRNQEKDFISISFTSLDPQG